MVRLVPPQRRPVARRLLQTIGTDLRHWLVSRLVSMTVVGLLTWLGLWIVGVPASGSLGLLAGLMSFIPNFGPVLSALPGIPLGLSVGSMTALWATIVYVIVQLIEGNVIMTVVEQRAVSLPAAFLLTVQILMGLLAGVLGLLVATPLVVVVVLAIRELYVVPLERGPGQSDAPAVRAAAP